MARALLGIGFILLILGFLQGCRASDYRSTKVRVEEQCQNFKVIETMPMAGSVPLRGITTNQRGSSNAFLACAPESEGSSQCHDRVFVENIETGQLFELQDECFLPWRPYTNLGWSTDEILVFDQWANPNYGHHFAVLITSGELIEVWAFNDQNNPTPMK